MSHRAVCNLYINTVCFLHFLGIDHKRLVPEAERPAAIEEEPEAAYLQTLYAKPKTETAIKTYGHSCSTRLKD